MRTYAPAEAGAVLSPGATPPTRFIAPDGFA